MKIARLFIITFLLVGLLPAQGELKQESYWIYTYSSEMKDYQINDIENDQLVLNNGKWDVKVSLDEVEMILSPPKPGLLGQILGGGLGGYCGGVVGFIPGFCIWIIAGGTTGPGGPDGSIILATGLVGAGAGIYYGSKFGGNLLKGQPEVLADMAMWTLDEKKEWIQNNLINY
jgi:hypothetical protein